MQRKNSLLNRKSGFAMIMAIAVIVVIATIMALSLSLTATTTKRTTDIYLYEQSALYAKGALEHALLRIAKENNRTTDPCHYKGENYTLDGIYDINVTAKYVYTDFPSSCDDANFTRVKTKEENGSVLFDITVTVEENVSTEPIRYFRRTLQKL